MAKNKKQITFSRLPTPDKEEMYAKTLKEIEANQDDTKRSLRVSDKTMRTRFTI